MTQVNLFLVGAAKAGTSSLWAGLRRHPDIFAPADEINKEPSFFCSISRHMGLEWYSNQFVEGSNCAYRLDASTAYLAAPESAAEIYSYNPDARILIVLREPAARAYSLYNWMVADGYESAPSFERALELEDARFAHCEDRRSMPQYFWNYMYRRSGLYTEQVARFAERFGDRLLLINFKDLVQRPATELERILDFLGLTRVSLPIERENASRQVLSPRLSFLARRAQTWLGGHLPADFYKTKSSRDLLIRAVQTRRRPAPMHPETRVALDAYFAPDLVRLRDRFGVDLMAA